MARPVAIDPTSDPDIVYNWTPGGVNDANAGALNGAPPAWSRHTATTWADDIGGLDQFAVAGGNRFNLSTILAPGIVCATGPAGGGGDLAVSTGATMRLRGGTFLFAVAHTIPSRTIAAYPTGTAALGTASIVKNFLDGGGTSLEGLGTGLGLECRHMAYTRKNNGGGGSVADVEVSSTCCAHAGVEIYAIRVSAGGVVTIDVYRNGAFVSASSSAGAVLNNVIAYHFIAGTFWTAVKNFTSIFIAQCCINAIVPDASLLEYCEWMAIEYGACLAPTKALVLLGDSIIQGYGCGGGVSLPGLLAARLKSDTLVHNFGIGLCTAAGANIPTVLNALDSMCDSTKQGYPIASKTLIVNYGVNDIIAGVTANTFATNMSSLLTAIRNLQRFNQIIGWVPPGFGMNGALSTGETERRAYRLKYLAEPLFDHVIDTDTLDPSLVPDGTSAKAVARHVTGLYHQTRQLVAAGSPPTGQSNDGLYLGHGADVIHGNELKHMAYAEMFARDSYVSRLLGLTPGGLLTLAQASLLLD